MKKRICIAAAIVAAAGFGLMLAQDNKPSPADQALQRLEAVNNTASQPAAIYVNQLRMLAEQVDVSSGPERPYGFEYYSKCLEKVRAAKDKSALEWLGGILQLEDISNDILQTSPYCTVSRMYEDFSRAWYELQWDGLSAEDKMKVAFYGFVPGSPVAPDPQISVEYIAKIGNDARKRVYEILMDKNLKFDMSTPYKVWRMGYWKDLLSQDIFKPTDDELKNIYANGGEYGKMVAVSYSITNAKPYVIGWLKEIFENSGVNPQETNFVFLVNLPANVSADFSKKNHEVCILLGSEIIKRMQSRNYTIADVDIFYMLCSDLDRFGKSDDSIKLIESFIAEKNKADLDVARKSFIDKRPGFGAYVSRLYLAANDASELLKRWSGKDEDE